MGSNDGECVKFLSLSHKRRVVKKKKYLSERPSKQEQNSRTGGQGQWRWEEGGTTSGCSFKKGQT